MGRSSVKILGFGGSSHDFSAAIIVDGEIIVAIEDERLDRVRHADSRWNNQPAKKSLEYCLQSTGLKLEDFDAVVTNEGIASWPKFVGKSVFKVGHHMAHASSAFFTSEFEKAAILVVDGSGGLLTERLETEIEKETISIGAGSFNKIQLDTVQSGVRQLTSVNWQQMTGNSLGIFYKIVSDCLGFGMHGQGKIMGLAPYGDDRFVNDFYQFVNVDSDGRFEFDPYGGLYDWIGEQLGRSANKMVISSCIAYGCQTIFEDTIVKLAETSYKKSGCKQLAYGGGCALNISANQKILEQTSIEDIHIFPAAGDSGLSVGAALYYHYHHLENGRLADRSMHPRQLVYTGHVYSEENILTALSNSPAYYSKPSNLLKQIAQRLFEAEIIGVFRGRSEFGPRALGNRSLLASPFSKKVRDYLNCNVKIRESFRPFGPIVPLHLADKYFEIDRPSPFMLVSCKVREEYRDLLQGVTHVDGSARVQTLVEEMNPFMYQLLLLFGELSGTPVLINTSFNGPGQPILESPKDALKCFHSMPINTMVLEDYLVEKHTPWENRRTY